MEISLILKTVSEKHEFFQSYLRAGASYRPSINVSKEMPFNADIFSADIQAAVSGLTAVPFMQCAQVSIRGTNYKTGYAVILEQGKVVTDLCFGVIKVILIDKDDTVHFVVEEKVCEYQPHLQTYKLKETCGCKCVRATDLVDYLPLFLYNFKESRCVILKHGVMLWG